MIGRARARSSIKIFRIHRYRPQVRLLNGSVLPVPWRLLRIRRRRYGSHRRQLATGSQIIHVTLESRGTTWRTATAPFNINALSSLVAAVKFVTPRSIPANSWRRWASTNTPVSAPRKRLRVGPANLHHADQFPVDLLRPLRCLPSSGNRAWLESAPRRRRSVPNDRIWTPPRLPAL